MVGKLIFLPYVVAEKFNKNTDAYDYTMKISDIKVNGKTTNVTRLMPKGKPDINWTTQSVSTEDYDFGTLGILPKTLRTLFSTTCFVIPQNNENLK